MGKGLATRDTSGAVIAAISECFVSSCAADEYPFSIDRRIQGIDIMIAEAKHLWDGSETVFDIVSDAH